jgi:hypothetical protein
MFQQPKLVGGSAPSIAQINIFPSMTKDKWCGKWEDKYDSSK